MQYLGLLDFSAPELFIIFAIVLLLFGGKKLPDLANSIGKSASELKKGLRDAADLRDEAKTQASQIKQSWSEGNKSEHPQEAENHGPVA